MSAELVQIPVPGTDRQIVATLIDGKPMVSLRHACEAIGLAVETQRRKLNSRSWATATQWVAVGADGKSREMTMIDRRTMTMWLGGIDENRVNDEARPILIAFQAEAADALVSGWSRIGGAWQAGLGPACRGVAEARFGTARQSGMGKARRVTAGPGGAWRGLAGRPGSGRSRCGRARFGTAGLGLSRLGGVRQGPAGGEWLGASWSGRVRFGRAWQAWQVSFGHGPDGLGRRGKRCPQKVSAPVLEHRSR